MLGQGKYFLFISILVILGISACLKEEVVKRPEDVLNLLGTTIGPSYVLDDQELSVALRICFSLRGHRMRSHYRPSNEKEVVKVFKKDCLGEIQKEEILMAFSFDENRPILKGKNKKGRGVASGAFSNRIQFKMETEKHGDLGELCQEIMKGLKASNQLRRNNGEIREVVQLSFFKGNETDKVVKLRSIAGTIVEADLLDIGTGDLDGESSLGRLVRKTTRLRCPDGNHGYSETVKAIFLKSEGLQN